MAHALRLRLYERNALATIVKNYGDEVLARVLPVAVALTLARNLDQAKLDRACGSQFGASSRPIAWRCRRRWWRCSIGLEDFARWLPALHAEARADSGDAPGRATRRSCRCCRSR